mmetsp:Transcript_48751/g.72410  ORF Transcript_48751/g.72410 Transcript_48751/m.72410 type:complete len:877 (+) Transcript_48751:64-2694(+)
MDELNENEANHSHRSEGCHWVPEYGAWMVEATPNRPYTGFSNDLLRVERNMRLRRKRMLCVLKDDEVAPTVSSFFRLGAMGDDGSVPASKVGGKQTESDYIGDAIINPHPRFGTLSANIRRRRGEKVCIRVPLYRDEHTPEYKNLVTAASGHGCCGSDALQLWRYGKGDASRAKYGMDKLVVGCAWENGESLDGGEPVTMDKWLVHVKKDGCQGIFYRSAPNVIVADSDWPRNGDVVVGSEITSSPGWIRLQNGYYLPMASSDGSIQFLHKVSTKVQSSTSASIENKRPLGANTPLFRQQNPKNDINSIGAAVPSPTDLVEELSMHNISISTAPPTKPEATEKLERVRAAIHMDAMAFGMGCCCLQVTFQAKDIDESRFIYDQLAVMAPILMALTASTPILKGRLADTDCRWGVISEGVDDRTSVERGVVPPGEENRQEELAGKGQRRIYKSRYDSISCYIYQGGVKADSNDYRNSSRTNGMENRVLNMYNDLTIPIDEDSYEALRKSGIDPALSQHIAALFVRDPLVIFDGAVEEVDDDTQTEHFENIQSTNWQTVRWKPPPPRNTPNDPHIGWRTEFRSMEMQLTDFENAAFTVFIVLITRIILTFDLNLYIPLSRVDANMQRAHSRNASAKAKFFFRRHMAPLEEGDDGYGVKFFSMFEGITEDGDGADNNNRPRNNATDANPGVSERRRQSPNAPGSDEENSYEEMTMAEIMTGKGKYFPGLIPLVQAYLEYINCDEFTMARVSQYLDLIKLRATGELITPASWMRKFVRNHESYKGDSVVSDEIAYDLMIACKEIGEGTRHEPDMLGDMKIREITKQGAYDVKLDSKRVQNDKELLDLLSRYTHRESFKGSVPEAKRRSSIISSSIFDGAV